MDTPRIAETYEYAADGEGMDLAYVARVQQAVSSILGAGQGRRVFDLGCGDGRMADWLSRQGFVPSGVDLSPSGIAAAKLRYPRLDLHVGDACAPLAGKFGTFPFVVSVGVLEHIYAPRKFVDTALGLTEPGGIFVCAVPFHGYWKNLAIALAGKFDQHVSSLWDHGHIKFFSERTLSKLLTERGFVVERMVRVGRIPPLASDLFAVARRPH